MIKWEALAAPKDYGGSGFIGTKAMNISLLTKWIHKFERGDDSLALEVLRMKYLKGKSFYQSRNRGSLQFWQGLEKSKGLV